MRKGCKIIFIFLIATLLEAASCSSGQKGSESGDSIPAGIPLPQIPEQLSDPGQRADFLAANFWSRADLADTALIADTARLEQAFADFCGILPSVSEAVRMQAVTRLLGKAKAASPLAISRILEISDRYLYDPHSPLYNESLYQVFLECRIRDSIGDVERARFLLEEVKRNAPGSKAPDFTFSLPDGSSRRLFHPGSKAGILLFFYEPDCGICAEAEQNLIADLRIAKAISDGAMRLVMIYPGSDRTLWLNHTKSLPAEWEIGMDKNGLIDNDELYTIKAIPSFYLIAPNGTIILKDSPLPAILATLFP